MLELNYAIERRHLTAYHNAVKTRVSQLARPQWWMNRRAQSVLVVALVAVVALAFDQTLALTTGSHLNIGSAVAGFLVGYMAFFLSLWLRYLADREIVCSENGLTLSARTTTLNKDELITRGRQAEARYSWALFEDVTSHPDILVLWSDPGGGVIIPRSAFANANAEAEFLALIRQSIASAKQA